MKIAFLLLLCLGINAVALSPTFTKRYANIASVNGDGEFKSLAFVMELRFQSDKPMCCELSVSEDRVFRMLPNGKKVPAAFTDLHVGQRVMVSGNAGASTMRADEIVILEKNLKLRSAKFRPWASEIVICIPEAAGHLRWS